MKEEFKAHGRERPNGIGNQEFDDDHGKNLEQDDDKQIPNWIVWVPVQLPADET